MTLWLDDQRNPRYYIKDSNYIWVTSYNEFISFINSVGLPDMISFDNDLGTKKEGYDCAKWLINYCIDNNLKLPKYEVHSANPVAKKNIETLLNNYRKYMDNKLVTFGEAVKALKNGSSIHRQIWDGTKLVLVPKTPVMDEVIIAHLWNGHNVAWVPTQDDILNDDWVIE